MKGLIVVLLLAAVALPAVADIFHNNAELAAMCDMYANDAAIAVRARDKGLPYANAQAGLQNAIAIGASRSSLPRDDKAFMAHYLSGAVAFAYASPPGTTPDAIREQARTACRNQFGL